MTFSLFLLIEAVLESTHNLCFLAKISENNVNSCKPHFSLYKGFSKSQLHWLVNVITITKTNLWVSIYVSVVCNIFFLFFFLHCRNYDEVLHCLKWRALIHSQFTFIRACTGKTQIIGVIRVAVVSPQTWTCTWEPVKLLMYSTDLTLFDYERVNVFFWATCSSPWYWNNHSFSLPDSGECIYTWREHDGEDELADHSWLLTPLIRCSRDATDN